VDLGHQRAGRRIKLHALAAGNAGGPGVQQVTVLPTSGIRTVKQLAGKTIAVNALAGLTVLLIDNMLTASGMTPSQVHYTVIPFPSMPAALAAHRVDAAFLIEPYLTQAETKFGVQPLFDLDQGATRDFPLTGYVATSAWMRKYPRTAAAFTRALEQGQRVAATSRPAVEKALLKNTTISKQTAAIMALGTFPLGVTAVQLGRVGDLMQEEHAVSEIGERRPARPGDDLPMTTPPILPATVKGQVTSGFAQAADRYDEGGTEFFKDMGGRLVDLAGVHAGAHVLDVGCGKGAVTLPAARLAGTGEPSTPSTWPPRC
jgi:NMT1/THI5 like